MDTFKPADYYQCARDELATCVQKGPVNSYIDRMKHIQLKLYGIIDDEVLDQFVCRLEPVIGREILKENPQPLKKLVYLPNEF